MQKEKKKYIHIENVSKSVYTTIFGFCLMSISLIALVVKWFFDVPKIDGIPSWELAVVASVGFILLFMRDNMKIYLDLFIRKRLDIGDKDKGFTADTVNPDPPPPPIKPRT